MHTCTPFITTLTHTHTHYTNSIPLYYDAIGILKIIFFFFIKMTINIMQYLAFFKFVTVSLLYVVNVFLTELVFY